MGNLSIHFDGTEFRCPCCGSLGKGIETELIRKLELLFDAMNAGAIIITSGYRCPPHSVAVGGYANDAHTKGIAADIKVRKIDGSYYKPETVAREAEKIGFSGIGIMTNATHVDIRNAKNYYNSHWFGDERTGENIATFKNMGEPIKRDDNTFPKKIRIKVYADDVLITDKEIEI